MEMHRLGLRYRLHLYLNGHQPVGPDHYRYLGCQIARLNLGFQTGQ